MGAGRLQGSFERQVTPNWALGAVQVGRPGGLPEFTRWARGFLRSEKLMSGSPGGSPESPGRAPGSYSGRLSRSRGVEKNNP